jgi:hypothetical protein
VHRRLTGAVGRWGRSPLARRREPRNAIATAQPPDEIRVRLVKLQQRLAHRTLRAIQRRQVEIERARERRTFFLPFTQQLLDHIGHTQRAEDARIGSPFQHR